MKKFRVSADEILYYFEEEIDAETEDEAKLIYLTMLDNGQVDVNKSDLQNIKIREHMKKFV